MKNLRRGLFSISVLGILFFSVSNAAEISNFSVVPPTGGATNLTISWDQLSNTIMSEFDGYALQWGASANKTRNVDTAQLFFNSSEISTSIRAADFDRNEYHYFRVYAYKTEGRLTTLAHGSKVLKWKWLSNGTVEKEFVDAQDPVISTSSSEDDRVFTNIQVDTRDTYAGISWSAADLATNEGYLIEISKKEDFSDVIAEYYLTKDVLRIRVDGFFPETNYYIRGSLHNSSKEKVGNSITKNFKTIVTMSDEKKALIKRLKDRGVGAWVDKSRSNYSLENENASAITTSTSISTTSSSTSSTTSTTSKRTSLSSRKNVFFDFDPKLVTEKELNSALTELALMQNKIKNQIRKLRLQNK
jgi:hypothetical protein